MDRTTYLLLVLLYTVVVIGGIFKLRGPSGYVKPWNEVLPRHLVFLLVLLFSFGLVSYLRPHLPTWLTAETIPGKGGYKDSGLQWISYIVIAVLAMIESKWAVTESASDEGENAGLLSK